MLLKVGGVDGYREKVVDGSLRLAWLRRGGEGVDAARRGRGWLELLRLGRQSWCAPDRVRLQGQPDKLYLARLRP